MIDRLISLFLDSFDQRGDPHSGSCAGHVGLSLVLVVITLCTRCEGRTQLLHLMHGTHWVGLTVTQLACTPA